MRTVAALRDARAITWRGIRQPWLWRSMLETTGVLTLLWIIAHWVWLRAGVAARAAGASAGRSATVGRFPTVWLTLAGMIAAGCFVLAPWATGRFYDHLGDAVMHSRRPWDCGPSWRQRRSQWVRGIVWIVGFIGYGVVWLLAGIYAAVYAGWFGGIAAAVGLLATLPWLVRLQGGLFLTRLPLRRVLRQSVAATGYATLAIGTLLAVGVILASAGGLWLLARGVGWTSWIVAALLLCSVDIALDLLLNAWYLALYHVVVTTVPAGSAPAIRSTPVRLVTPSQSG